jgi:SNF2 family DNA or RNA helicase
MIIVDEAHRLKNEKTLNYRFIKSLTKKYFLLLTATPVQNSVKELFNLVNLIRPGIFGTWQSFRSRYIIDERARTINLQKRSELQKILSGVIVRTRRDEVRAYLKFPNRVPRTHRLRATPQERELYQRLTQMIREEDRHLRSIGAPRTSRFQLINLQRQLTSSTSAVISALNNKIVSTPTNESIYRSIISLAEKIKEDTKMKMIRSIVSQNEKSSTKYLIFTSFLDTQKYIQNSLTRNGFSVVLYNGQMSTSEKDVSVLRFKQDTQIMISTEAGSEGKNFQFCNNLINYDLPWNPMQVEQRVGRLHRIGQKKDVIIHSLSIKNTIEDYILILLYEKIRLFQMTIGDLDIFLEDDIALLPEEIFDIYMNSTDEDDAENRFSVLSEKLLDKKKVAESVQQFDSSVFQNFDLSSLPMVRK